MWNFILLKFWQAVTCWCSSRPPLSRLRNGYSFVQLLCPGNCCPGHSTGDCSASRGHLGLWGNQTVQAPLREARSFAVIFACNYDLSASQPFQSSPASLQALLLLASPHPSRHLTFCDILMSLFGHWQLMAFLRHLLCRHSGGVLRSIFE